MKTSTRIIIVFLLTLSLNACSHNNGDIGDLFGTWKLQSITIDNECDTAYQCNVLWKFQSSIISMVKADDSTHTKTESWGTWSYANDDTQLILDFTHTDNDHPNVGSSKYSPMPDTHLPKGIKIPLDIIKINSDEMTLRYIANDGSEYIYHLKHWI